MMPALPQRTPNAASMMPALPQPAPSPIQVSVAEAAPALVQQVRLLHLSCKTWGLQACSCTCLFGMAIALILLGACIWSQARCKTRPQHSFTIVCIYIDTLENTSDMSAVHAGARAAILSAAAGAAACLPACPDACPYTPAGAPAGPAGA